MLNLWVSSVRGQFGAAIEALERAIEACPDGLWSEDRGFQSIWYVASHTAFWLDYYLSGTPEGYAPPPPFGLEELDPAGVLPPRVHTKRELLDALARARRKLHAVLDALDEPTARSRSGFTRLGLTHAELLLYNLRHVAHHTGQLQLELRRAGVEPPRWVRRAEAAGAKER